MGALIKDRKGNYCSTINNDERKQYEYFSDSPSKPRSGEPPLMRHKEDGPALYSEFKNPKATDPSATVHSYMEWWDKGQIVASFARDNERNTTKFNVYPTADISRPEPATLPAKWEFKESSLSLEDIRVGISIHNTLSGDTEGVKGRLGAFRDHYTAGQESPQVQTPQTGSMKI